MTLDEKIIKYARKIVFTREIPGTVLVMPQLTLPDDDDALLEVAKTHPIKIPPSTEKDSKPSLIDRKMLTPIDGEHFPSIHSATGQGFAPTIADMLNALSPQELERATVVSVKLAPGGQDNHHEIRGIVTAYSGPVETVQLGRAQAPCQR